MAPFAPLRACDHHWGCAVEEGRKPITTKGVSIVSTRVWYILQWRRDSSDEWMDHTAEGSRYEIEYGTETVARYSLRLATQRARRNGWVREFRIMQRTLTETAIDVDAERYS